MNDETLARITNVSALEAQQGDLEGSVLYMMTGIYRELKAIREVLDGRP